MKVLLVHNFYRSSAPSGEDAVYRTERTLLEQSGIQVVPFERYNDDIDDSTLGKRVGLALAGAWSRRSYQELAELIRHTRPDVAHFHNTFPLITPSGYAACQEAGVPVVQTLHNFRLICPQAMLLRNNRPCELCLKGSLVHALRHSCYRDSLAATLAQVWTQLYNRRRGTYRRQVNSYIALTRFAAERFIDAGFPSRKMSVLANTLAEPPLAGPGDGGYALYVGRLAPEKGVRVLLEAWQGLKLPLKIAGDGPLRAELAELAQRQGLPVEFLGYLNKDEVTRCIQRALFQVVPSQCYEGFPVVVLEAMACGTPVVASRIGSLCEVVLDGITGVKFNPGEANDLAAVVKELQRDPVRLAALRQRARGYFVANFGPAEHVTRLRDIYTTVMHEVKGKYLPT
jgi:glycosyltransferase involved in cell wall biosynthesis